MAYYYVWIKPSRKEVFMRLQYAGMAQPFQPLMVDLDYRIGSGDTPAALRTTLYLQVLEPFETWECAIGDLPVQICCERGCDLGAIRSENGQYIATLQLARAADRQGIRKFVRYSAIFDRPDPLSMLVQDGGELGIDQMTMSVRFPSDAPPKESQWALRRRGTVVSYHSVRAELADLNRLDAGFVMQHRTALPALHTLTLSWEHWKVPQPVTQ